MTKAEMRVIFDVIVIAWAKTKSDYEIIAKDNGEDAYITECARKDFEATDEALKIMQREVGIE